jgi:hypothetical protein
MLAQRFNTIVITEGIQCRGKIISWPREHSKERAIARELDAAATKLREKLK